MEDSNLKKFIKVIGQVIKNPKLLSSIYYDNNSWRNIVEKDYGNKILPTIPLEYFLNDEEEILYNSFLDGGSLLTDYALLQSLARKIDNCRYFEIGTWRGESVANVSRHAKKCYTLNIPLDKVPETDRSNIGFFSSALQNVKQLYGDSKTFDFKVFDEKFDLIFIDGDHRYEYVKSDTHNVYKHLIHDKSIVVWHDYGMTPESVRYEVFKGILDGLPEREHYHLYHVSNTKCAILTREAGIETTSLDSLTPTYNFETKLTLTKLIH